MKNVFAQTFPSGQPTTSVTSITLVNATAKTQDITVPTDTLWLVQMIKAVNADDVNRVITIEVFNEAAKTSRIGTLAVADTATGVFLQWPNNEAAQVARTVNPGYPMLLGPGMTISVTWASGGASTGGTDADGLVIWYRKLPLT